jgi:hypothetical protein
MTVFIICTVVTVDNGHTCVYKYRPTYVWPYVAGIHLRLRITKYIDTLLFVGYSVGVHVSDAK